MSVEHKALRHRWNHLPPQLPTRFIPNALFVLGTPSIRSAENGIGVAENKLPICLI